MLLVILAGLLSVVLCALWIFIPQRKLQKEERIPKKKLILSIIMGLIPCTICIIILDEIFDKVFNFDATQMNTYGTILIGAFIRAALIEEVVKFIFVKHAIKKIAPQDNLQFMLVAGTIGMGYNIMEKVATFNAFQEFINAVYPMHIFLQFLMGAFLFRAALAGDNKKKKILYNLAAFFVTVVVHGSWDWFSFSTTLTTEGASGIATDVSSVSSGSTLDTIFSFAFVILAIAVIVFTAVYLKKMKIRRLPSAADVPLSRDETDTELVQSDGITEDTESVQNDDITE